MEPRHDVIVVGAGIAGASLAYFASEPRACCCSKPRRGRLAQHRPLGRDVHGELRPAAGARADARQPRVLRAAAGRLRRHAADPAPRGALFVAQPGAARASSMRLHGCCRRRLRGAAGSTRRRRGSWCPCCAPRCVHRRRARPERGRHGRACAAPGLPARHRARRRRAASPTPGHARCARARRLARRRGARALRGAAAGQRGRRLGRRMARSPAPRPIGLVPKRRTAFMFAPPAGMASPAGRCPGVDEKLVLQARRRLAAGLARQRRPGAARTTCSPKSSTSPSRSTASSRDHAAIRRPRAPGPACAPSSPTASWSAAPIPSAPASSGRRRRAATASRPPRAGTVGRGAGHPEALPPALAAHGDAAVVSAAALSRRNVQDAPRAAGDRSCFGMTTEKRRLALEPIDPTPPAYFAARVPPASHMGATQDFRLVGHVHGPTQLARPGLALGLAGSCSMPWTRSWGERAAHGHYLAAERRAAGLHGRLRLGRDQWPQAHAGDCGRRDDGVVRSAAVRAQRIRRACARDIGAECMR